MAVQKKYKKSYTLMTYILLFVLIGVGLLVSSCDQQSKGFALPEGDIAEGKAVYQRMSCYECHSISEIAWKGGIDSLKIPLGGEVSSLKTYGELVTSVINPSHKIARAYNQQVTTVEGVSKMKNYNEVLTVQELVDLVAFLQSEYELEIPSTEYFPYH